MKFVKTPTQIRIFQPPPHYQLLHSRGEQDPDFWKEVATALVNTKNNMETSRTDIPSGCSKGNLHMNHFSLQLTAENRSSSVLTRKQL